MQSQLPQPDQIFVDHLAHFVPNIGETAADLERLGYVVTPFTPQFNADPVTGELVPAGTGNRCIMLRSGYIEILTSTADTPLSQQMKRQLARYVGVHLIAFSTGDIDASAVTLAAGGFEPAQPVRLRRQVGTPDGGSAELRFSVVRVPPDKMPEGRIQVLTHHTPELMWQERWLDHPNRIEALTSILLAVVDPEEAAQRFGRFLGRKPERRRSGLWRLQLDRGELAFSAKEELPSIFPEAQASSLPLIAAYALGSSDLDMSVEYLSEASAAVDAGPGYAVFPLPRSLGGTQVVCAPGAVPPWSY